MALQSTDIDAKLDDLGGLYRHHSCAIAEDREQYDAFGLEERKVFEL